jgi:hypothetical protein
LTDPAGGKEPLRAEYSKFELGSDHQVYEDSSFGIPAIYLNDWPDRYIHTNFDIAANIDPTKLGRAALIGAASGYFLASFSSRDIPATERAVRMGALLRNLLMLQRSTPATPPEMAVIASDYERRVIDSIKTFGSPAQTSATRTKGDGSPVFRRRAQPRGPLTVFGYDYFEAHAKPAKVASPRLLNFQGEWGSGEEYAYEALNLADGRHSVRQITNELSTEYGSVPVELVTEYLEALKHIGVVD